MFVYDGVWLDDIEDFWLFRKWLLISLFIALCCVPELYFSMKSLILQIKCCRFRMFLFASWRNLVDMLLNSLLWCIHKTFVHKTFEVTPRKFKSNEFLFVVVVKQLWKEFNLNTSLVEFSMQFLNATRSNVTR